MSDLRQTIDPASGEQERGSEPRAREREIFWHERNPAIGEVPLSALAERPGPESLAFVRRHFDLPVIDAASYRLILDGAVGGAAGFSLDEIQQLPFVRRTIALECAGNARFGFQPPVPRVQWGMGGASVVEVGGTALAPLLAHAEPRGDAREVLFAGPDSGRIDGRLITYERTLTLEEARDPGVLLVWEMNGKRLTPEQGFPLRLVVPGWYAMASVKWLMRMTVLTEPHHAYFQHEDYVYDWPDGTREPVTRMRPRAVIVAPAGGARLQPGPVTVSGIAWSGTGRIERVLVSTDDGAAWEAASLDEAVGDAPRRWSFAWTPRAPGKHAVLARAEDRSGNTQPLSPSWNALGYGNNAVQRIEVTVLTPRS